MSTYLYCVLPGKARPPVPTVPAGLAGVEGGSVRALLVDHVVAWVSDVQREIAVSVDGVKAHDAVVEAALETGATPVPARFGQRFVDDEACRAALISRGASVESLLSSMQGLLEMTIIVMPSTRRMIRDLEPVIPEMFEPAVNGTGRRYLETLRSREAASGAVAHATDGLAQQLADATSHVVRRSLANYVETPIPIRTISYLIARDDVTDFRRAVARVERGKEFQFLMIGPRAPYSFCALRPDTGGMHGMNLAD
jgi:hypothetical protein